MEKTDLPRFTEMLAALASTFNREADRPFFMGYEMALDDLPIEAIERACRRAIRKCKFMPSGAELRELAGELSGDARPALAWRAFEKAVVAQGGYRSVLFDDPLINATVRNLGGWQRCCELPAEEFDKWLRKDFLATYEAYMRGGVNGDGHFPLVGIFAQQNAIAGKSHPSTEPRFICTGLPAAAGVPLLTGVPAPVKRLTGVACEIGRMPTPGDDE